ncbi:transposase [Pseudomonas moorei]|uniref:Uncharacterized protein n=1 Tax=Pseudomonas moorei TaxID=395599 RepID=A0A1H1IKN1_9PSED|nr:transposase [Pseudomonas moorei]KAB0509264.1 transposase [Pseudomonas moorei]SDR37856.1 hypothetical protein SAMN04490195_5509 [Pseudomonas moorei]
MTPQQKFGLIVSRQARFKWGDVYVPSTMAVPREAPKGSRISRLNSRKLGRTLHTLSTPERVFTQLALYHPDLLDIHEQKMLSPVTTGHPLRGHPLIKGTFPNPLRGTLEIATEIGFKHYEIAIDNEEGNRHKVPYPYQGDLLLYMKGHDGIPYAVNWSVKDKIESFTERRRSSVKTPVQQRKDREHAQLRAKLEKEYYSSAGIRTVQVSLDLIESAVIANLDLLFSMHDLPATHSLELFEEFSCDIQEAVKAGYPVAQVMIRYGARWGNRDQFIARFYQDVWNRKLLVNLFEPILIDHPLTSEQQDLLSVYGTLFEESEK